MLHRKKNPSGASANEPFQDDAAWKKFPSVVEFLTVTEWGPEEKRKPGTVLLFVDGGRLKCCLTDKDANLVAFTSLDSLSGCLAELEALLARDQLDWRQSKWMDQATGKGRKA